jgi:hypothetical protein
VIAIFAACTPIKDRAVYNKMIRPGLNPHGTVAARSPLEYERWLVNTDQIAECLTSHQVVDPSITAYAVKLLSPAPP